MRLLIRNSISGCVGTALLILAVGILNVNAAEFVVEGGTLKISGPIVEGDFGKFQRLVRSPEGLTTFFSTGAATLDSPGGNVIEAMRIAKLLELSYGTTIVQKDGRCFSACFLIYAAGSYRLTHTGARLGVHRITLSTKEMSIAKSEALLAPAVSSVEVYLKGRGIPSRIIDRMNETAPTDMFIFDNRWLRDQGLDGAILAQPGFIDIVDKHCGVEPSKEATRKGLPFPDIAYEGWLRCMDGVRRTNRELAHPKISKLLYSQP